MDTSERQSIIPTIESILARAFEPGEVDRWWIDQEDPTDNLGIRQDKDVWLHIGVKAERFDFRLLHADPRVTEDVGGMRERLESDLQDWIAESRFAWGQQRLVDPGKDSKPSY